MSEINPTLLERQLGLATSFTRLIQRDESLRVRDAESVVSYLSPLIAEQELAVPSDLFDAFLFGASPDMIAYMPATERLAMAREKIAAKTGELMIVRYFGPPEYGSVAVYSESGNPLRYVLEPSMSNRMGRVESAFETAEEVRSVVIARYAQRIGDFHNTRIGVSDNKRKIYVGQQGWRDYEKVAKSQEELRSARKILRELGHKVVIS